MRTYPVLSVSRFKTFGNIICFPWNTGFSVWACSAEMNVTPFEVRCFESYLPSIAVIQPWQFQNVFISNLLSFQHADRCILGQGGKALLVTSERFWRRSKYLVLKSRDIKNRYSQYLDTHKSLGGHLEPNHRKDPEQSRINPSFLFKKSWKHLPIPQWN